MSVEGEAAETDDKAAAGNRRRAARHRQKLADAGMFNLTMPVPRARAETAREFLRALREGRNDLSGVALADLQAAEAAAEAARMEAAAAREEAARLGGELAVALVERAAAEERERKASAAATTAETARVRAEARIEAEAKARRRAEGRMGMVEQFFAQPGLAGWVARCLRDRWARARRQRRLAAQKAASSAP